MRYFLLLFLLLAGPLMAAEDPDQVTLGDRKVHLEVSAWRDFMPQIGGDGTGSPLMLTPSLVDESKKGLEGVVFSEIVATFQGQEWKAGLGEGGTARGGPRWPTGVRGLMVRAHYAYQGRVGWLRLSRPTSIGRTE
jgi:hypothetical protein